MPGTADPPTARLGADPDFRRYYAARVCSHTGSAVTQVVLPVLVYATTGSPLWTSLVAVAGALPYLLLGLPAGALADRHDRRRLMVAADLANAGLLATLPLAHLLLGMVTAVHVLLVALATRTVFVLHDAANFGALPTLVGRGRVREANITVTSSTALVQTVVPPLAGLAMAGIDPAPLLLVDAVSFLASAHLVRAVTRPLSDPDRPASGAGAVHGRLGADVVVGLRFLLGQPAVRAMTLLTAAQSVAGGAWTGQLVVWADREVGVVEGDWRLGLLFGAWGVGGFLSGPFSRRLVRRLGAARVTLVLLPASATVGAGVVLASHWLPAALLLLVWGACYTGVVANGITTRQLLTPEPLQSRVNAAGRMLSYGLGWPVGALLGGVLSQAYGPQPALLAAVGVLAGGAVAAWLSPLRTARPEVVPQTG